MPYQSAELSLFIFNPGFLERQQTTLRSESALHVGHSLPFRRESSVTMTQLFFFTETSLMQDVVQFNLSDTFMPGNHCPRYCLVVLAEPLACNARAPGMAGQSEEMCLLCWAGACCHCPYSFSRCVWPGGKRTGNPLCHACCLLSSPSQGR